MNFEELHNEINSYPPELKYKEDHWKGALSLIKAHERKQAAKKWLLILASAFVIYLGVYSSFEDELNQLADYVPRTSQKMLENHENGDQVKNHVGSNAKDNLHTLNNDGTQLKNVKTDNSLDKGDQISILKEDVINVTNVTIQDKQVLTENYKTQNSGFDIDESSVTQKTKDKEINILTPIISKEDQAISSRNVEEKPVQFLANVVLSEDLLDTKNLSPLENEESLTSTELSPSYMVSKMSNFLIETRDKRIRGSKQNVLPQTFSQPLKFIGLQIGLIPLSEYGRSNKMSKIDFSAGVIAQKPISHNLGVSLGLSYFEISGMETSLQITQTSYGFGFENNITKIHTDKVQFLKAPINLTYDIGSRIQLESGLGVEYILYSKNFIEQSKETNAGINSLGSEETSGYFSAFKRASLHTNVGLSFWLNQRYRLGVNYQFGLTDITKNETFNSESKHKNTSLNFTLTKLIK